MKRTQDSVPASVATATDLPRRRPWALAVSAAMFALWLLFLAAMAMTA